VSWSDGYVTPFDVFKEVRSLSHAIRSMHFLSISPFVCFFRQVRVPDFRAFKKQALEIYSIGCSVEAMRFIQGNRHMYARPREFWTIEDMAKALHIPKI
jgi:hypothetical protein